MVPTMFFNDIRRVEVNIFVQACNSTIIIYNHLSADVLNFKNMFIFIVLYLRECLLYNDHSALKVSVIGISTNAFKRFIVYLNGLLATAVRISYTPQNRHLQVTNQQ